MEKRIRYGDSLGHARARQIAISDNQVTAYDARHRRRPRLRPSDIYRLWRPPSASVSWRSSGR
jgi:hypothetical protein